MKITETTTEKTYEITYFRSQSKGNYGFSIKASGNRKNTVVKEARELLEQAIQVADEVKKTDSSFKEVQNG